MKVLQSVVVLESSLLLASCGGGGLSGTYIQSGGMSSMLGQAKMTFSGNKVQLEMMGSTTECKYEKEGDKIKLINGDKNQILTIDKNGCLDGGDIMGKFCKQ